MAATPQLVFLLLVLVGLVSGEYPPMTLTIVNNCPFTIWPAIQPNSGNPLLHPGGFSLPTLSHLSLPAPTLSWSGRIWARTSCTSPPSSSSLLSCVTGDCAGRLDCAGAGGTPPATLVQLSLHVGGDLDLSSYGVSLVDGFNLPVTVTPQEGQGTCPVVGCKVNLLDTCPWCLRVRVPEGSGPVVACRSACDAFRTDEFCCRNKYSSPRTCTASCFSEFFKEACPTTYTYAQDTPSLSQRCSAAKELKVIFCH